MKWSRVIRRRIERAGEGVNVVADLNAVVTANVDEPGAARTSAQSRQTVVQRSRQGPRQGKQGKSSES